MFDIITTLADAGVELQKLIDSNNVTEESVQTVPKIKTTKRQDNGICK